MMDVLYMLGPFRKYFVKPYNWKDWYFCIFMVLFVFQVTFFLLTFYPAATDRFAFIFFFFWLEMTFIPMYLFWGITMLWNLIIDKEMISSKKLMYGVAGLILFPIIFVWQFIMAYFYFKHVRKKHDPKRDKHKRFIVLYMVCVILAVLVIISLGSIKILMLLR